MIETIKKIFGLGPKVNYGELIAAGAMIIDVRSKMEFAGGHVKGSFNVPLEHLSDHIKKIKNKEQVILTCCASGMRSASAKGILRSRGFNNVHNAGSWHNLKAYGK